MCFKKVRTEMIEYIDGVDVDQGTLKKWFPMDHRYRVPHLIMITYEVEGKPQTVLVHIRGHYLTEVTNKNRAGYRAGFFPGDSEPIQVMGPKLPRITHISSYVQGPDQMMIWITIWERRNHNEVTESESDQRERGDRPGSGEPSVQEEQEKGQDEPTEERSPRRVEAPDEDNMNKDIAIIKYKKKIKELREELKAAAGLVSDLEHMARTYGPVPGKRTESDEHLLIIAGAFFEKHWTSVDGR